MPTRKELIDSLRSQGINEIWGRGLSVRTKAELEEFMNAMRAREELDQGKRFNHLSYSQVSDYLMCGLRYYFKRLDANAPKFPPNANLRYGKAYHMAIAAGFEDIRSGSQPPKSLVQDAFAEAFNADADQVDWTDADKDRMEFQGLEVVDLYRDKIMPTIWPEAVEEGFRVSFQNRDWTMFVVPDLEGKQNGEGPETAILIDHKTGSKAPDPNEARDADQLSAYALAHLGKHGKLPDKVRIDRAVRYKTQPKKKDVFAALKDTDKGMVGIATIEAVKTDKEINRYLKTMEMVIEGLIMGRWQPASTWAWWCSEKACDYWQYCHEEF